MTLRHQHFYLTGDGRSSATDDTSQANARVLAYNIIMNVAARIKNAGWTSIDTTYKGITLTTSQTVTIPDGESTKNLVIYFQEDTDNYVFECPFEYEPTGAKLYLLYNFKEKSYDGYFGADITSMRAHLSTGSNKLNWFSSINSTNVSQGEGNSGLACLYMPPGTDQTTAFRLTSMAPAGGQPAANIATENSTGKNYTYSILTENDLIIFLLHGSYWEMSVKGFGFGEFISELLDENDKDTDTVIKYRKYFGFNLISSGAYSGRYVKEANNITSYYFTSPGHYLTPTDCIPQLWYDCNGNLQVCNNKVNGSSSVGNSVGLFAGGDTLISAVNRISYLNNKECHISKIFVGNNPVRCDRKAYITGECKVSENNSVKGTLNTDYFILVDYFDNNGYNYTPFQPGVSLNNHKYRVIGAGIAMGWDPTSNVGPMDTSDVPMTILTAPDSP